LGLMQDDEHGKLAILMVQTEHSGR